MLRRLTMISVFSLCLGLGLVWGASAAPAVAYADPAPDVYAWLPALSYVVGTSSSTSYVTEVQNVGVQSTNVGILLWREDQGFCPPMVAPPFALMCSGLLQPGASWSWTSRGFYIPSSSAFVFSYQQGYHLNGDRRSPVVDCNYLDTQRRTAAWPTGWDFYKTARAGSMFPFDHFGTNPFGGQPIVVKVMRQGVSGFGEVMTGTYSGLSKAELASYDTSTAVYTYVVPVVKSSASDGTTTSLQIQNAGDVCTSVQLTLQPLDNSSGSLVSTIQQLAPGYTAGSGSSLNVGTFAPPGFVGSLSVRSSQPLSIEADEIGSQTLTSFTQLPGAHTVDPRVAATSASSGAQVLYGALTYRETQGWETQIQVQNMAQSQSAKVAVTFMDSLGAPLGSAQVDMIGPGGVRVFTRPAVADGGSVEVGAVRVESQSFTTAGGAQVAASPIGGVVQQVKTISASGESPSAIAYNLVPESQAFDWPAGSDPALNVSRLAVPSFHTSGSSLGFSTELAIQNVNPSAGWTGVGIYLFNGSGYVGRQCRKLEPGRTLYLSADAWSGLPTGFDGSIIIQATASYVPSRDNKPPRASSVVGLSAVAIDRRPPPSPFDYPGPGDGLGATNAFPLQGRTTLDITAINGGSIPMCTMTDFQ